MSDIQTFKLKSSFRRELLKFKWAGHIEEESARLHAHLCVWPSHLVPQSRVWFCFCKWGFGGGGQPPTAPTPLGSSLVMCGLNRFSSESTQQTWQKGSPLPQPENAKNPTGKMEVLSTPEVCFREASSRAAHCSISGPPELPASKHSPFWWAGTWESQVNQEPPEDSQQTHFCPEMWIWGVKIVFYLPEKNTLLKSFIWLQSFYFISHATLSHLIIFKFYNLTMDSLIKW